MKVKLLKKIRKRFDWYIRKSDQVPIVLDLKEKTHYIFTDDLLVTLTKYENAELMRKSIEISIDEYRWRLAKDFMYKKFGYKIGDAIFRQARRRRVNYKNKKS